MFWDRAATNLGAHPSVASVWAEARGNAVRFRLKMAAVPWPSTAFLDEAVDDASIEKISPVDDEMVVEVRANGVVHAAGLEVRCRRLELRAGQVREVLCAIGVPLLQFVSYRNFGLHLDKLIRNHSGITLLTLTNSAIDYWTVYGLHPEVLKTICEQVFGLEL